MAWYQIQKWEDDIRKNYQTNSPFAVIRAITSYSARHDIELGLELGYESREHFINDCLGWFISKNKMATKNVYECVKDISRFCEPGEDSQIERMLCTSIPKWFMKSCSLNEIPIPPEDRFEFTSYSVDESTLTEYPDVFPLNTLHILLYSPLKDPSFLMEKLETLEKSKIIRFLNEAIHQNISLIDEPMLLDIVKKLGCETIQEFIKLDEIDSSCTFLMNIPVRKVYEYNPEFWKDIHVDISYIMMNPNITISDYDYYCKYSGRGVRQEDFIKIARHNEKLLLEYLRSGFIPRDKYVTEYISSSKELQIDDILSLGADIDWDWEAISRNPNIATSENIRNHPDIPWVWGRWGITTSPSIDEAFIEENLSSMYKHHRYDGSLSYNPKISSDFVKKHPEIEWVYGFKGISNSKNIKLPFLLETIGMPWDMGTIVQTVILCENTAAQAIQSWWKLRIVKYNCKELSKAVVDWYYHPDCKIMMNIRKKTFMETMSCV